MSLDYVRKGESVKASTINSVIDAIHGSGNQAPDMIVTGTQRGPQYTMPTTLGSTTLNRWCLFDEQDAIMSAWPMAKLMLGFTLNDCLNGMRVHQGSFSTIPTSAVVVHQNSAGCPFFGGELSGYVLTEDDFGKDAEAGATGWVPTKLEGMHASSKPIQLQAWKAGQDWYQVFTNASNDDDIKSQLSATLQEGGADASSLSALLKVDAWTLASQTSLSVGNKQVPTSKISMKHGIVDTYFTSGGLRAILKAKLMCYKTEEEGSSKASYWAWFIPLGPDASYDDSNEVVYTSQLTFGGDPIAVEARKDDIENFDGQATWLEGDSLDSSFPGNCIAFGSVMIEEGAEQQPDPVYFNLRYDEEKQAVVAQLANAPDEEASEDLAVLQKNIFVASSASLKPSNDTGIWSEAPEEKLLHGTLGDLYKDGPKLDSYTPMSSEEGKESKSIEWATRESTSGIDAGCHCLQLYNFDKGQTSQGLSSDAYLARRKDDDTGSFHLEYIPLSSMTDIPPDSTVSAASTWSIEKRVVTTTTSSETSDVVSTDMDVIQLWDFDKLSSCYMSLTTALSAGEQHLLLRNASLSTLQYMQLSALSVTTDSQGGTEQKSMSWLSGDYVAPFELQLHGFDKEGDGSISVQIGPSPKPLLSSNYEFLVRKGGAGGELGYVYVAAASQVMPDSLLAAAQTSSLQSRELSGKTSAETSVVVQLYDFEQFNKRHYTLSDALSASQDVVLRNASLSSVEYLALSALSSTAAVDSESELGQKSIGWAEDESGQKLLQIWNFDNSAQDSLPSVQLSTDPVAILPNNYEFMLRKGGAGGEVAYATLQVACLSGGAGGHVDVDAGIEEAQTSSVQYRQVVSTDPETQEQVTKNVLEMYNFHEVNLRHDTLSGALSAEQDIVLRNASLSCVEYLALSALSIDVDSEGEDGQKSISWVDGTEPKQLQLYGMDLTGEALPAVTLSTTPGSILPEDYELVVRKNGAQGEISYATLQMAIPEISGGGSCSCDLSATLLSGTTIARWTKDGENWIDIYCLSGSDITMTGTDDSVGTGSSFRFQSAVDSNIEVTVSQLGVIEIGAYYI